MTTWLEGFAQMVSSPLAILGFSGQALFFSRWIVQWIASEKKKQSHVPILFWWISLIGGLMLLVYALARRDPVFVLGQAVGILNYGRNIVLIRKHGRKPGTGAPPS